MSSCDYPCWIVLKWTILILEWLGWWALPCPHPLHENVILELSRLRRAAAVRSLRDAVNRHHDDLLCIAETKIQHVSFVLKCLGFQVFYLPLVGRKGRMIVVALERETATEIILESKQSKYSASFKSMHTILRKRDF